LSFTTSPVIKQAVLAIVEIERVSISDVLLIVYKDKLMALHRSDAIDLSDDLISNIEQKFNQAILDS
jgi:hypothetical protein